jgi:hypothetical protein
VRFTVAAGVENLVGIARPRQEVLQSDDGGGVPGSDDRAGGALLDQFDKAQDQRAH